MLAALLNMPESVPNTSGIAGAEVQVQMTPFQLKLKRVLKHTGWSNARLGKQFGVQGRAVSAWVRGVGEPRMQRLVEIQRELDLLLESTKASRESPPSDPPPAPPPPEEKPPEEGPAPDRESSPGEPQRKLRTMLPADRHW